VDVLGRPEGEFYLGEEGRVLYRSLGESRPWFANANPGAFRESVAAWNRYGDDVARCVDDAEQREVAGRFRDALAQTGALDGSLGNSFWASILEQVESGLL
jgi:hypothetical protein